MPRRVLGINRSRFSLVNPAPRFVPTGAVATHDALVPDSGTDDAASTAPPLRILMLSRPLHPLVGGLETAADVLATQLVELGQSVTVATMTPSLVPDSSTYKIVRCPSPLALLRLFLDADCVVAQGMTLQMAWPKIFLATPTVVIHQGLYPKGQPWALLRELLAGRVTHVAISAAVRATIPKKSELIFNAYDVGTFFPRAIQRQPRSLIFVGRLVPEKGLLPLIQAVADLRDRDVECSLTIVGEGPFRHIVEAEVKRFDLESRIRLTGPIVGAALAEMMSAHQIAVVPSLWPEPLGIVALEAIACGCEVVGTTEGGLPEAIGPCGRVVPNGDVSALAFALSQALQADRDGSQTKSNLSEVRSNHLRSFHPRLVAIRFLDLFRRLTRTVSA